VPRGAEQQTPALLGIDDQSEKVKLPRRCQVIEIAPQPTLAFKPLSRVRDAARLAA
jgi:hypothetical protein